MKSAIISIGLPGAGKTTILNKMYSSDYYIISADEIKEKHPDYNPKNTELIHEWSVKIAESMMDIISDTDINICMDSGGVNKSYSLRIINMLKTKGYHVTLVYIDTPLSVCLERNKSRIREVPEEVIIDKSRRIESCLEKQRLIVDEFIHIK